MSTFEAPTVHAYEFQEHQLSSWQRVAGAVLHIAGRFLDNVAEATLPGAPHDYASEHFNHAEKRNDPSPNIDLSRSR